MDIRGAANGEKNVCLWTVVLVGGFALAFRSLSALSTPPQPTHTHTTHPPFLLEFFGLISTITLFADGHKRTHTLRVVGSV